MKILKILLGPELFWIILYGVAVLLARANKKSGYAYDAIIENAWFYIPLLSVLVFGLYRIPYVEKNWLWLGISIASIIIGHFVLETLMSS